MAARYDVVVVGARCAGAALAIHLARAGLSVCVVDRARFPSETLSTHVIQACGVQALGRLGIGEAVAATTAPLDRAVLALGGEQGGIEDIPQLLGSPALNVRRVTLDRMLVEAAAAAGACVVTGTSVVGLTSEQGRVTGVRTGAGEIAARLVVGADGAGSTVAALVEAGEYAVAAPGRMFAWGYLEGVDVSQADVASTLWFGKPAVHGFLASPTDGGLFMAAATVDLEHKTLFTTDRERSYRDAFAEWPALADLVARGSLVGPVRLVSRWRGFFRESAGRGWALVGDAGHFKDPTPGQGISDAFRQAERLAAAIVDGLAGARDLDEALHAYWRWRDHDAWEMYWFAHDLGAPGPTPPLQAEVQRRIAGEPRLSRRLARVLNHEAGPSLVTPATVIAGAAMSSFMRPTTTRRAVVADAKRVVREEFRRRGARPELKEFQRR
jgi:flavin-dependent dehydrogenase